MTARDLPCGLSLYLEGPFIQYRKNRCHKLFTGEGLKILVCPDIIKVKRFSSLK
jgi:hypothetical protein